MGDESTCPCTSGTTFDGCCGPLLAGRAAPNPERLMRSRYTAFVKRDSRYLLETWHPGTRPETLELDADTRWTGLDILDVAGGGQGEKRGTVEFAASFLVAGSSEKYVQRERSRFVRQSDRWWYLDGVVDERELSR